MDSSEMEMETEKEFAGLERADNRDGEQHVARNLLTLARQLVNQGKPSQALQAVLLAMRTMGGNEAVSQSLHRARDLYRNRLRENAAVNQLASLFAECAIADAQAASSSERPSDTWDTAGPSAEPGAHPGTSSILAETGRNQIMLDAFADGSSFVCLKCGALVSSHRREEHYAYWCG